jgi:hypothetical protein
MEQLTDMKTVYHVLWRVVLTRMAIMIAVIATRRVSTRSASWSQSRWMSLGGDGVEDIMIIIIEWGKIAKRMSSILSIAKQRFHKQEEVRHLWTSAKSDWPTCVPRADPNNQMRWRWDEGRANVMCWEWYFLEMACIFWGNVLQAKAMVNAGTEFLLEGRVEGTQKL